MKLTWAFFIDSVEFTPAVIAGTASLGGSESACLGLARALKARGHDVTIFTTQLHASAPPVDHAGVNWVAANEIDGMSRVVDWDVFVALRMPQVFSLPVRAKFRVLWNQDMMTGTPAKNMTMAMAWAYDLVAYVSEYHRKQWEGQIPELKALGWATKNGFDPQYVPKDAVKDPNRVIHITRPERGLRPLLAMWPELKRRYPAATLSICRYNSMYDAQGWGRICASYDDAVKAVNEQVGGITYLGELGKPALYQAIAESAVMWYPGVVDFAETSCIAAIEAQACGTPFVGSWKGALPETVPSGTLIDGNADADPAYAEASIAAVIQALEGCKRQSFAYRKQQQAGLQHVGSGYTYDSLAGEWEAKMLSEFQRRRDTQGDRILQRLLHEDDHTAAQMLARELGDQPVVEMCQFIIDGKEQVADDYSARAMNPLVEIKDNGRIPPVADQLKACTRILDLACGNGTIAIGLAQANPSCAVVGIDYAPDNIAVAKEAAEILGVADRTTFLAGGVYDFATHEIDASLAAVIAEHGPFDGVFIGEFLEHIGNVSGFLNALHRLVPGARVCATMPSGAYVEIAAKDMPIKRGHVHHFRPDDLAALFGEQAHVSTQYIEAGLSNRWNLIGTWVVAYDVTTNPVGQRPYAHRLLTTRPFSKLSVGIIASEAMDLRRCLSKLWPIADEIVIGDTGDTPEELLTLAREYNYVRVVPVGQVSNLKGGFSEARNVVLRACTGEWFFWIDSDEQLVRGECLHRCLEGTVFNGLALKQNHLMLDSPKTFDTPVRVFRRMPGIQFYGCVHEQPQMGDCNGDIVPALQLDDVQIAHLGYLTESLRKQKDVERNLPLLIRDQQEFPDRRLGKLLWVRQMMNNAQHDVDANKAITPHTRWCMEKAITIFETHFSDPADKYHALARPFYEAALRHVSGALECEFSFAAQANGLKGKPRPEKVWVRTPAQLQALLKRRMDEWVKPMQPEPIDVEPIVVAESVQGVAV